MKPIQLHFHDRPGNGLAILKALILPRKGFNAAIGLPDLQAHWHGVHVDKAALNEYLALLDIEPDAYWPIAYPHVLAGTMHMNMLAHGAFPIRLLGALHLKNRIVQYRPIALDESVDIDARFGEFRLVEKGVEFDLVTEVKAGGSLVWQETSIYLARGRYGGQENPSPQASFELPGLTDSETLRSWHVPGDRGRQYAAISGDYNPIHVSALLAKVFGFDRDIAHGFGILAQALEYSARLRDSPPELRTVQMDVVFKGPVYLQSELSIKQNLAQSVDRFDIYCDDNDRPNLCVAVSSAKISDSVSASK